jgi:transposase
MGKGLRRSGTRRHFFGQGFFTVIGDEVASKIVVFVCSDMWEPYLKVIREKCSDALHILDRFHIVAKMNKALDEIRAGESRRMASDGLAPVLKKSRWLLLKREENLKTEQRFRLRDLLRYNLKTVRAYLLKEAFQQLWDYSSPAWAGKFLDESRDLREGRRGTADHAVKRTPRAAD